MPTIIRRPQYCTVLDSIATANPEFTVSQTDAAEFMLRTTGISDSLRKRIPQIYARSGIDSRHTVVQDYTREFAEFDFYPAHPSLCPSPTTGARNKLYEREAIPLATQAASNCIDQSNVEPTEITHLIVVSCTGFFAPGLDIHLIKNLGLSRNTRRTIIGFMGCFAAFNALRMADSICSAEPEAKVLIVCLELCTLHFQIENSLESVIVNALFSDGAAAVLLRRLPTADCAGKLIYRENESYLDADSMDAMSWAIGDKGYIMGLSASVPEVIGSCLPAFVEKLLQRHRVSVEDIGFWAVHPGGRQILDRTMSVMEIDVDLMEDSYTILRENGNMSSPTILYILNRIMSRRAEIDNGRYGIALAFGPGLTIEGCLLEIGS